MPRRILPLLVLLAAAPRAEAHLDVYRADLAAVERDGEWRFAMTVEGSEDIEVAVVTPPGGQPDPARL
jgi:hypothetical protein